MQEDISYAPLIPLWLLERIAGGGFRRHCGNERGGYTICSPRGYIHASTRERMTTKQARSRIEGLTCLRSSIRMCLIKFYPSVVFERQHTIRIHVGAVVVAESSNLLCSQL